jgi:hypothetical protein
MLVAYPSGAIIGSAVKSKAGAHAAKMGQIAKLKKEGWRKGIPDLLFFVARGGYHGLVIEMKDQGKTQCSLLKDQKFYLSSFEDQGYKAIWCAGSDQAIAAIDDYLAL